MLEEQSPCEVITQTGLKISLDQGAIFVTPVWIETSLLGCLHLFH